MTCCALSLILLCMGAFSPRFTFLEIVQLSCYAGRHAFTFPQSSYRFWCMLASQNGTFEYALANHRGLCGPGDFVLCPPGVTLHRRMLEPLTFSFALVRWVDARRKPLRIKAATLAGKWAMADWHDSVRILRQLAELENSTSPIALDRRVHLLETLIRHAWYDTHGHQLPGADSDALSASAAGSATGASSAAVAPGTPRRLDAMAQRAARVLEARSGE